MKVIYSRYSANCLNCLQVLQTDIPIYSFVSTTTLAGQGFYTARQDVVRYIRS